MSHALRLPCDAAAIRAAPAPATAARPGLAPWILAATILGSSLAFIDGTVVTVALPSIARELHATGAQVQWVVESYALFLSALLLVGGSLGDHFGRRRVYAFGIILFTIASIACGLAPSTRGLILARSVQGIGAALLVPGSLAILSASFEPQERGRAIGTWSGFSGITAALGPLLGGWLVNHSWRWAFLLNVPIAAIVLLLLSKVPESKNPSPRPLDGIGALVITAGLGALVFGLIESSTRGWADPMIVVSLGLGALGIGAFILVEARARFPMLPLGLFGSGNFTGANTLTLFLYGSLAAVFFFLPLDLIQVQGYSPFQAGAALLPFIGIVFLLSRWSGGLVERLGPRRPLIVGPLIAAVGFFLLSVPGVGGTYVKTFFLGIVVLGFGMATSIAPLTTTVMNAVAPEEAGIASGVNNAASRAAGLLSIALLGAILAAVFGGSLQREIGEFALAPYARDQVLSERTKLAGAEVPRGVPEAEAAAIRGAIARAFVSGFRAVARVSAVLAVLASLCAWIWIQGGPARGVDRSTIVGSDGSPP